MQLHKVKIPGGVGLSSDAAVLVTHDPHCPTPSPVVTVLEEEKCEVESTGLDYCTSVMKAAQCQ